MSGYPSYDTIKLMFEEYIFAFLFGILAWIASLQFAKLYPHNVKYGKYVLYLHSLLVILGIYQVILSYFEPTQLYIIQAQHKNPYKDPSNHTYIKILIIFSIPAHFELFITNFIFFQWLKIYFSVGVTEGWLVCCKWFMTIMSIISFMGLISSIILCIIPLFDEWTLLIYQVIMYTVGTYCVLMAIGFITVAIRLMKRVIKTTNLSGVRADKSVCRRLLGSGIILSTAYFIQGLFTGFISWKYVFSIK